MFVDAAQNNLYVTPTTLSAGQPMQVMAQGQVVICDVVGRLVATYGNPRNSSQQLIIPAPDQAGIYILKDSNHATAKIIVR